MEILILKDGEIFARTTGDDDYSYSMVTVADSDVPEYPAEKPSKGKYYELSYIDGNLQWVEKDRPLSTEERLEQLQEDVNAIKNEWKVGESAVVGDRRYYNGTWYTCIQAHTTQADWTPDIVPALWQRDTAN